MSGDHVQRAMSDDGAFRVIVARSTQTVRGVLERQAVTGEAAVVLGDLVTGVVLYRETMAPTLRVQGAIRGAHGSGQIIADSHPDGWVRGLCRQKEGAPPFHLGPGSLLRLMRSLPSGELHQGVVELPPDGGVSDGLMSYMQQSEQVVSVVKVRTLVEGGVARAAGGYIVQLLPEAPDREGAIEAMASRLEGELASIEAWLRGGADVDAFMERLYDGTPFTRLDDTPFHAGCDCSKVRVLTSLATLDVGDLRELLADNEALDLGCDWCGANYRVEAEELRALLTES